MLVPVALVSLVMFHSCRTVIISMTMLVFVVRVMNMIMIVPVMVRMPMPVAMRMPMVCMTAHRQHAKQIND